MTLSNNQLKHVCLLQESSYKTCRYLKNDDLEPSKWYCCKLRDVEKKKTDTRIRQFIKDCKDRGLDPKTVNVFMGDNCGGYPLLKFIEQGYDCD
jgi:hypothetical protein